MTDQEGAISGRICDRPVADLFQWLHETRSTGLARFRTALGTATVWFRDGELVDADMGRFHLDAAVLRLMRIQDGEYEIERKPVNQRRLIKASTAQLLAEGRQRAPRPGPSSGPSSGSSAGPSSEPGSGPGRVESRAEPSAAASSGRFGAGASPRAGSGEYSLIRDESRPRRRGGEAEVDDAASGGRAESEPRRGPRVDTGAHTLLDAKAVQRPPAKPPAASGTDAHTVVARRPPAAATPPAVETTGPGARGPAARRRGLGWSPTASGTGQPPEPAPSTRSAASVPGRPVMVAAHDAPPPPDTLDEAEPRSGRTRFMFGVTGPGATEPEPNAAAHQAPSSRAEPEPTPVPSSAPSAGAVAVPMPPDDSARTPTDARRRRARARAVVRAQAPFEPERTDKTLLRPGPLPPPPGQPVVMPASTSQPIPLAVPAGVSQPIPLGVPAPVVTGPTPAPRHEPPGTMTTIMGSEALSRAARNSPPVATPFAAATPAFIDEEYSHPISVPTAPPNVGPVHGDTWVQEFPPSGLPLPNDPNAEQTLSMRVPDVVQAREPSLSTNVKAGGTAHVGRYEVLLRLARGGMGTVYLCRVTGEGGFRRLFALKVIRDHLNTNQAYVQMLLEEARIASRLSHPNIVSIIDIDTFAGQHYLVMDYVEGCTLSELTKAHPKARPPELLVPIVLDALTGLHAAHSMRGDDGSPQPVVHCDFSPQNMLVGVNGTCRLTDFGVSKAADALPNGPGRGKPGYLSPEQVRGLPLDPRSDVFSAGVVLWNALTGEQLFDGDDPQAVLHQVISRTIPKPSSVGLRPPACFDRICLKALERDPDRRYQSAEQMLTDLRKVAIAEDLLAPSSEVGRWVQDTFGAQIELRRQAAGLAPNLAVAALALRDLTAAAGPSGHSEGAARDGSITGHDPNASMTMMLRPGAAPAPIEDREGFGARTRMVVVAGALAFMGAAIVTLFVRPDLLQGGIIDENGVYVDLSERKDQALPLVGTSGGPAVAGDDATGGTTAVVAEASEGDTGTGTDTEPETVGEPDPDGEPAAEDDGKAKGRPSRGKGKPDARKPEDGKPGDGEPMGATKGKGKGKGTGKPDGGSSAPPPDLDELFRPPGG